MSSNHLAIPLLVDSQSSKYVTVNDAINALDDAICQELPVTMTDADYTFASADALGSLVFVMSATLTAARNVIVPSVEKPYIFKNSTTGGFKITVKTSAGTGIDVRTGDGYVMVYCDGTNVVAVGAAGSGATAFTGLSDVPSSYSGAGGEAVEVNSGATALVFSPKPFDVGVFAPGVGTNSQKLVRIPLARAVTFPAGAAASVAKASAAATGSTTFTLSKNGTSFATVNFAASASSGIWTQASAATFAAGDVLEIDGPGTADATLADVGITLSGVRS